MSGWIWNGTKSNYGETFCRVLCNKNDLWEHPSNLSVLLHPADNDDRLVRFAVKRVTVVQGFFDKKQHDDRVVVFDEAEVEGLF